MWLDKFVRYLIAFILLTFFDEYQRGAEMNQQVNSVMISMLCFAKRVLDKGNSKEVSNYLDSVCYHIEQFNKAVLLMEKIKQNNNELMLRNICDRSLVVLPLGELVFLNFISVAIVRCCICSNGDDGYESIISDLVWARLHNEQDVEEKGTYQDIWHEEEINAWSILDRYSSILH